MKCLLFAQHVEVATRIIIAGNSAIPASALCITRKLYLLSSVKSYTVGFQRKWSIFVDLGIGLGIPLIQEIFCALSGANVVEN
jgi:pheromone a factor receptor